MVPSAATAYLAAYGLVTSATCGSSRTAASIRVTRTFVSADAIPPGSSTTIEIVPPACTGASAASRSATCWDSVPGSEKSFWYADPTTWAAHGGTDEHDRPQDECPPPVPRRPAGQPFEGAAPAAVRPGAGGRFGRRP